jgi:hypothetical protein
MISKSRNDEIQAVAFVTFNQLLLVANTNMIHRTRYFRNRFLRLIGLAFAMIALIGPIPGTTEEMGSIVAARSTVDLSSFAAFGGEPKFEHRNMASQSYVAVGYISEIARQVVDQLKTDGWKQVEGGLLSDAFTSLDFTKNGFALSLSVSPTPDVNLAIVKLKNHGNLRFRDLPFVKDLMLQHSTPNIALYHAPASIEETQTLIRSKLIENGWEEFGQSNEYECYRKSSLRLMVSIRSAAALKGKTVVQVTSEQLWYDLPVPFPVTSFQCDDATGKFTFTSEKSLPDLIDFYTSELKVRDWTQEKDKLGSVGGWSRIQFKNPAGAVFGLAIAQDGAKSKVAGLVRTAEQVAIAEANSRKHMSTSNPVDATVILPKHLKIESQSAKQVEVSLGARGAAKATQTIVESLEANGWKVTSSSIEKDAGVTKLSNGDAVLTIEYSDPGLLRAKLSIMLVSDGNLDVEQMK